MDQDKEQPVTEPQKPEQTDNTEREGIDPPQTVSQDPEMDYSEVSE